MEGSTSWRSRVTPGLTSADVLLDQRASSFFMTRAARWRSRGFCSSFFSLSSLMMIGASTSVTAFRPSTDSQSTSSKVRYWRKMLVSTNANASTTSGPPSTFLLNAVHLSAKASPPYRVDRGWPRSVQGFPSCTCTEYHAHLRCRKSKGMLRHLAVFFSSAEIVAAAPYVTMGPDGAGAIVAVRTAVPVARCLLLRAVLLLGAVVSRSVLSPDARQWPLSFWLPADWRFLPGSPET